LIAKTGTYCRDEFYRAGINSVNNVKQRLAKCGIASIMESLSKLFYSGMFSCIRMFVKTVVTLGTHWSLVK